MTTEPQMGEPAQDRSPKLNRIQILTIDPHEIVHDTLAIVADVFDDLMLIGAATNAEDGVTLSTNLRPDVVITSLHMPDMDGFTLISTLTHTCPDTKVIVLGFLQQPEDVEAALQAGASQCLSKDISIDEFAKAIRNAVRK